MASYICKLIGGPANGIYMYIKKDVLEIEISVKNAEQLEQERGRAQESGKDVVFADCLYPPLSCERYAKGKDGDFYWRATGRRRRE